MRSNKWIINPSFTGGKSSRPSPPPKKKLSFLSLDSWRNQILENQIWINAR